MVCFGGCSDRVKSRFLSHGEVYRVGVQMILVIRRPRKWNHKEETSVDQMEMMMSIKRVPLKDLLFCLLLKKFSLITKSVIMTIVMLSCNSLTQEKMISDIVLVIYMFLYGRSCVTVFVFIACCHSLSNPNEGRRQKIAFLYEKKRLDANDGGIIHHTPRQVRNEIQ